jgi:hypothetical protein
MRGWVRFTGFWEFAACFDRASLPSTEYILWGLGRVHHMTSVCYFFVLRVAGADVGRFVRSRYATL